MLRRLPETETSTSATTSTRAAPSAGIAPRSQASPAHVPWVGVTARYTRPAGNRVSARTPVAALGPSFRTVVVNVTDDPATTEGGLAAMVASRVE